MAGAHVKTTPSNPSVFPLEGCSNGMTLRDWFAGQALAGLLADSKRPSEDTTNDVAASAYRLADAMLRERERK